MNESGQSVKSVTKFYKLKPENIIVFHDELDLEPGKLKVKSGGGNAGHNGLKSIQSHLSSPDFYRVRIGIGHPGDKNKVHNYVLKDFTKREMLWVAPLVHHVSSNIDLLLSHKFDLFLNVQS
jgi:PTH1 family peptidyl-tRNA hydrolase